MHRERFGVYPDVVHRERFGVYPDVVQAAPYDRAPGAYYDRAPGAPYGRPPGVRVNYSPPGPAAAPGGPRGSGRIINFAILTDHGSRKLP
jgi:hypothetical protein